MTYLARHQWIRQIRDCADAFDAGAKVPRVGFSPYFRAELVTALRDLAALIEGSADQEVLNVQTRRALGLVLVCMFPDPTEDLPADAERELKGLASLEDVAGRIHMLHQFTRGKEGLQ